MFGLDMTSGFFVFFVLFFFFFPFLLNGYLARSRGKSVILMLLLTLIFSWIVTLVLAFMPRVENREIIR